MITLIIEIEEETSEERKTLDYLNSLTGVSITAQRGVRTERENAWKDAIAEGAVTVDEFVDEVKR